MLGGNYPCLVLKLRRKVMFYLVKKLGLDICYRCGNKIEEEKELSLDHSEPWMYKSNALEIYELPELKNINKSISNISDFCFQPVEKYELIKYFYK